MLRQAVGIAAHDRPGAMPQTGVRGEVCPERRSPQPFATPRRTRIQVAKYSEAELSLTSAGTDTRFW